MNTFAQKIRKQRVEGEEDGLCMEYVFKMGNAQEMTSCTSVEGSPHFGTR